MFKEIKLDSYIAVVYYSNLNELTDKSLFDFSSMLYKRIYKIDSRYELNDLCNELLKENIFVCAIDLYFPDCTLDVRYRVEKYPNYNKYHLIQW